MSEQFNLNNRYQFMGLIGKGRLGDVYRAADNFFRREVALKMLRKDNTPAEFLQYFSSRYAQQIAVFAKLNNPNIIKTYDFTSLNGVPAWTMDLYSGANFSQYTRNKMPVEQAANLLIPVADALTYAHSFGIVHGNLKPGNILLGNGQAPILTDFGLAQWLSDNRHGYTHLEAAAGIGSPEYLAPEQAQGMPADPRTDVYSLGIIFYELITGRRPFTAMDPVETMAHQVTDQLPSPRYFVPNISQQAEQFLYMATAKNPAQRISSMSEFAMTLRSLSSSTATGAYYPPASYYGAAPSEDDDDDDDDEGLMDKIKASFTNLKGNKNAKIILIALLALIVAAVILLVVSGNNRKIRNMNATATQEAIYQEQTQQAVVAQIEEQLRQTQEAQAQFAAETQQAIDAEATAEALAAIPTAEPVLIPSVAEPIPTAAPMISGRFQSQTPADGTKYVIGAAFDVAWTIENTGGTNWTDNYKLVFDSGVNFARDGITEKTIGDFIYPGGANAIKLPCTAPLYPGSFTVQWHVEDENGNTVMPVLTITINSVEGVLTATPAPAASTGGLPTAVIYDSSQQ